MGLEHHSVFYVLFDFLEAVGVMHSTCGSCIIIIIIIIIPLPSRNETLVWRWGFSLLLNLIKF